MQVALEVGKIHHYKYTWKLPIPLSSSSYSTLKLTSTLLKQQRSFLNEYNKHFHIVHHFRTQYGAIYVHHIVFASHMTIYVCEMYTCIQF